MSAGRPGEMPTGLPADLGSGYSLLTPIPTPHTPQDDASELLTGALTGRFTIELSKPFQAVNQCSINASLFIKKK